MAKYDILKTRKLRFARFGGLSSVNQRGYSANPEGFHSPPATRGFYCFVWPYYEFFLLGGSWTKDPWNKGTKFSYIRDGQGQIITDKHPDYERLSGDHSNQYWSCQTKAWNENRSRLPDYLDKNYDDKKFDEILKALDEEWEKNHKDEPKWVLCRKPKPKIFDYDGELWSHLGNRLHPSAVLARHGSWVKSSASDYRDALEKELHNFRKEEMKWKFQDPKTRCIPTVKGSTRWACKDHLEVFIEKV